MILTEVKTNRDRKDFLNVPRILYRNDSTWVCPLDNDMEAIFDPHKNNFHQHGETCRWILKDNDGKLIGRVAAFINHQKSDTFDVPTGGMGFFEAIDNYEVAKFLFDTAQQWLSHKGMKAMQGPINFGDNDRFWGLLVDGFDSPSYGMNHNHPYYQHFFELYGFEKDYEQISNTIDIRKPFPDRFTKIADWVSQKQGYSFEYCKKKQLNQYALQLREIYNDAWQDFDNFAPMAEATIIERFREIKPIMDEKLIWFAYVNNEPAAFIVILPDINQLIKSLNGKLNLLGKLKFIYNKWKGVDRIRAVVMGTKKKYQKHGLESALFVKVKEYVLPLNQYKKLELSWVGDFNLPMQAIHKATGANFARKHITYIKKF